MSYRVKKDYNNYKYYQAEHSAGNYSGEYIINDDNSFSKHEMLCPLQYEILSEVFYILLKEKYSTLLRVCKINSTEQIKGIFNFVRTFDLSPHILSLCFF